MKVTGSYQGKVNITIEFPNIPEVEFGDYMPSAAQATRELFQPIADHLAAVIATIGSLPAPLMLVALDMVSESLSEATNTGLALWERAQAGEDANQIYIGYCVAKRPNQFGDMVDTEKPKSAFEIFVDDGLDMDKLDE